MKIETLLFLKETDTEPANPASGVVAYVKEGVIFVKGPGEQLTKTVSGVESGPNGELSIESGLILGDANTPPSLAANTDDLAVTDIEKTIVLRLSASGNYSLSGLAPANDNFAYMVYISNVGTSNITIKNNSASSIAANRFLLGGNKTLQSDEGVLLFYDPVSKRWRGAGILI